MRNEHEKREALDAYVEDYYAQKVQADAQRHSLITHDCESFSLVSHLVADAIRCATHIDAHSLRAYRDCARALVDTFDASDTSFDARFARRTLTVYDVALHARRRAFLTDYAQRKTIAEHVLDVMRENTLRELVENA